MTNELIVFITLASSTGFIHTIAGPDHYLPFIVMGRARKWSMVKTMWITFLCGLGHVGSSIVIGLVALSLGLATAKVEIIEGYRGSLAAWMFILFGLVYTIWGIYRAIKNKPHKHAHMHKDGTVHKKNITPWILFTIFLFGPCEALVFQFILPFKEGGVGIGELVLIISVFSIVTIITMLVAVFLGLYSFNIKKFGKLERYMHAIAGAMILLSGVAIEFLGL